MNFKPVFNLSGGGTPSANPHQALAAQDIAVGDLVFVSAAGLVTIATDASANLLGVAASSVSDASAGEQILVWDDPGNVYLATADAAVAQDDKYNMCSIDGPTAGVQTVDMSDDSGDCLQVFDLYTNYDSSAANTKVLVTIADSAHVYCSGAQNA